MTDIVERLREGAIHGLVSSSDAMEAADEIERLRAELETCRELRKLDALEIGSLRGASRLRSYGHD